MTAIFTNSALVITAGMLLVWLISLVLSDVSIVDIAWGLGFVAVAWTSLLTGDPANRSFVLPIVATVWGCRLSGYLAWRNHGQPEDKRYRKMRDKYGKLFPLVSLFTVFLLQGAIMWLVALPLQTAQTAQADIAELWPLMALGVLISVVGILFESIGDWQLARFKSKPENEGEVLDDGLWRYTRHPNYFGDFLTWWGIYIAGLGTGAAWWSIVGPMAMSILLMKVSGVTLLENSLADSKSGYREYQRRTNAFFPGPPKPAN